MALAQQPVTPMISRYREQQKTEEELLLMYRQTQDKQYLDDLAQRYMGLFRYLSGRYYIDGMDKDDLIQICYMGFLQGIKNWEPKKGAKLKNFLVHCASRELMTEVSRSNAKKRTPMFGEISVVVDGVCEDTDRDLVKIVESFSYRNQLMAGFISSPEEQLLQKETRKEVEGLLDDCLSTLEKKCVHLFYYENRQYSEICNIIGVKWKSVDNALIRSRRKLADNKELRDIL